MCDTNSCFRNVKLDTESQYSVSSIYDEGVVGRTYQDGMLQLEQ